MSGTKTPALEKFLRHAPGGFTVHIGSEPYEPRFSVAVVGTESAFIHWDILLPMAYRNRRDFEIAVICALPLEADAVEALFDKSWDEEGHRYGKAPGDPNVYRTGIIGCHNVVLAWMPSMGKSSAANVASSIRSSFQGIKLGLVVGICGGTPNSTDVEKEILLGDVIISTGLVQYDFGRQLPNKFTMKNILEDNLGRPNHEIRAHLAMLKGHFGRNRLKDNTLKYLKILHRMDNFKSARYPGADEDKLFEPTYRHKHQNLLTCTLCTKCEKKKDEVCQTALVSFCADLGCKGKQVTRHRLEKARKGTTAAEQEAVEAQSPVIHYGLIASGDTIMKSGEHRDKIAAEAKVIAFEMEGAGVWDNFPCVIIKGVCDYADSHKNKKWQSYAAATAAACMKSFLKEWTPADKPCQAAGSPNPAFADAMKGCQQPPSNPELSEKEINCIQAFCSTDHKTDFNRISPHHPGTCEWILHHSEFIKWENDPSTALWISGNPGMGKTVLSKFLVDKFETSPEMSNKVVYFFCSDQDVHRKTAISLLKTIIHQSLRFLPSLVKKYVIPEYNTQGERLYTSFTTLWNIFINIAYDPELGGLCCILDALDECEEKSRAQLLQQIGNHFSGALVKRSDDKRPINLKLLITSRPYESIRVQLFPFTIIRLRAEGEEENISHDIRQYVNHKVHNLARLRGYSDALRQDVERALLGGADGMFLWVSLMIEILEMTPVNRVRRKLKEFPKDIGGIYNRILQEISEASFETVSNILKWVVFAFRPLTLTELGIACATVQDYESFSSIPTDELNSIREDVELCRPLLKVQKDDSVHLVHQTTKEFLLQSRMSSPLIGRLLPVETTAHFEIAIVCTTYLSFKELERGPLDGTQLWSCDEMYQAIIREYPLLEYAAVYWYHHVHRAGEQNVKLYDAVRHSLTTKSKRELSFQIRQFANELHYINNQSPLHILMRADLTSFAETLIASESTELDTKDGSGQTALHLAVRKGCDAALRLVRLLLKNGVDVNAEEREEKKGFGSTRISARRTTLHLAAKKGHEAVVKFLLENGANVNAEEKEEQEFGFERTRTALHLAAEKGHETVVELLLENGANVNADMKKEKQWLREAPATRRTALHLAAEKGHEAVVQLLLESGANVNEEEEETEEKHYEYGMVTIKTRKTALHLAAEKGYEAMVRLLLENGANVNAEKKEEKKQEDYVMISTTTTTGRTALHLAAEKGHEAMMQLLLENGADVNAEEKEEEKDGTYPMTIITTTGRTALHLAAEKGYGAMVQLLLESGANVNVEKKKEKKEKNYPWYGLTPITTTATTGRTALHLAAEKGHEAVVQLITRLTSTSNQRIGISLLSTTTPKIP